MTGSGASDGGAVDALEHAATMSVIALRRKRRGLCIPPRVGAKAFNLSAVASRKTVPEGGDKLFVLVGSPHGEPEEVGQGVTIGESSSNEPFSQELFSNGSRRGTDLAQEEIRFRGYR